MCIALQNWLRSEGLKISITTNKNCISDIERFHKTVNEKLRIVGSEQNIEDRCTKFETILYIYNHKTKHNSTKRFSADIFLYAGRPDFNIILIMLSCTLSLITMVKCNNIEVNPISAKNGYSKQEQ